ncbi:MAG: cobalamin-dependent protein [Phycisphaerae bacterium]|nr:cobalamin-dependent protein [Phycisphaerae bacterium]
MNDKLTIWLADLFHDKVSVLDVVPLNLGYLASAVLKEHRDAVDLRLFKYPDRLAEALERERPDVLALSNYTWNARLSLHFARLAKRRHPPLMTVMGGPNIRLDPESIRSFLRRNPFVDAYIPLQAETPFRSLVGRIIAAGGPRPVEDLYADAGEIPGCCLAADGYRFGFHDSKDDDAFSQYPSPYLQGILDEFIADPRLVPIFETNRGCPYGCTFCAWGIAVLSRVRKRDLIEVLADFNYVAEHGAGQDWWFFADANFGILKRDSQIAAELRRIKDARAVPKRLNVNWAKGSNQRILEIMKLLRDMAPSQIAVQSFDPGVLECVRRRNLGRDLIEELIDDNHRQDCSISTDLLVGCSGESYQSHLETLRTSLSLGFDTLNINNIRMLPGSQIETDSDRRAFGLVTRFRFIPNSYGQYAGEFVYEIEEAIKATAAMSEAEMNRLKRVHFLIYLLWNAGFARHLLDLARHNGVNPLDVMVRLDGQEDSLLCRDVLAPLAADYEAEWYDTEGDLTRHFSDPNVCEEILSGKTVFEKLTWKYMAHCLGNEALIRGVINDVGRIVGELGNAPERLVTVLTAISKDRLKLDVRDKATLVKSVRYDADTDDLRRLKDLQSVPEAVPHARDGFTLRYEYSPETFDVLNHILDRHDYEAQPVTALCAALNNGMVAAFTYAIR